MTPGGASANPTKSDFARRHPTAYLWLHAIVGLLLAAFCTWAFLAIAEDVPEQGRIVQFDLATTAWLQRHGTEWGESIFVFVSWLGAQVLTALLIAVGVALIVRRNWRHLVVLAVTTGGGALLNYALKHVFHRHRPTFATEFSPSSWSFPSGHAMDSLMGYGLLAYWLSERYPRARRWIVAGAVALIILIGYARVYLGVHYVSDVVAGYCSGMIWLTVCVTGYKFAERRRVGPGGPDETK
jgi:membrane-associated phospholipid phosphatase